MNRQDAQQQMVRTAEQMPGVAEAAELYSRLEPVAVPTMLLPTMVYATGGNAIPAR